jgi:hypothetical protein
MIAKLLPAMALALVSCAAPRATIDHSRDRIIETASGEKIALGYDSKVKIGAGDAGMAAKARTAFCLPGIGWSCIPGQVTDVFIVSNDPARCVIAVSAREVNDADSTDIRQVGGSVYCTPDGVLFPMNTRPLENRH